MRGVVSRAADIRRGLPIHGFIGANGGGKSLAMVLATLPELDAGRPVLSTVRLLDWRNPRPCEDSGCRWPGHPDHGQAHPAWIPFTNWAEFLRLDFGTVLMDEVTGVAGSRDTSSLPSTVFNHLHQMRRDDVIVRWSAPSWARADVGLRTTTQGVTVARGYCGRRVPGRVWTAKRLFHWKTFDVRNLQTDSVTSLAADADRRGHATASVRAICVEWVRASRLRDAMAAYDTYAPVLSLIQPESGRCVTCGRRKRQTMCTCPPDLAETLG